MDIQKYRALLSAIESGSLTNAANTLSYTQPGISLMISSLEKYLGVQLIIRTKSGILPSDNMKYLKSYIQDIITAEDKVREISAKINGIEIGTLRIGTFVSTSTQWLPNIIANFGKQHPCIDLRIYVGTCTDVQHWMDNNDIDIGITSLPCYPGCDFIPLWDDPVLAVMSSTHPLAKHRAIDIHKLIEWPFIVPNEGADETVQMVFKSENIHPDIRFHIQGDLVTLAMIRQGLGVTVMPEMVTRLKTDGLALRPLKNHHYRKLGIAVRSLENLTPSMHAFIHITQKYIDSLRAPHSGASSSN